MTDDDSGDSTANEVPYRPRPPLWQPRSPERTSWAGPVMVVVVGLAIVGVLIAVTIGGESTFLSTTSEPVEVSVLRVDGVDPPNDAPAYYRYLVRLPDGAEVRYASPDTHRVGDRVLVMQSRGRVTGRIHLTSPRATRRSPQ